eukprot:gene22845-30019_t
MPRIRTAHQAYSVKFSPFLENRITVSTAQNFGIIGNGRQHVFDVTPQGVVEVASFETQDGLYDCAWSEENENILIAASGDGSIKVYDLAAPPHANPLREFKDHKREKSWNQDNVDNPIRNPGAADVFLSASGDTTVRVWDLRHPGPTLILPAHAHEVLTADWCKYNDCVLATESVDKSI